MLFEKIIETTIDIANPINFCADKKRHLMVELKNRFIGVCFKDSYILDIKEIINCGACHIVRTNGSGDAYIDVSFLAEVIVFSRWDILVGVDIVSHQQMVVGLHERIQGSKKTRAIVTVLASSAVASIAIGQKIAVRVILAQHSPMQPQASVVSTLLVCDQIAPAYKLKGMLDHHSTAELTPMFDLIKIELETRNTLIVTHKADLLFFENLLYSFRNQEANTLDSEHLAWKNGPIWLGPPMMTIKDVSANEFVSVLDIVQKVINGESVSVSGVWSRSLDIHRSSPLTAVVRGDNTIPSSWNVIDGNPRIVFAEMLKNILDFLVATREMVAMYNSKELIDKHINVWTVMRAAQRTA